MRAWKKAAIAGLTMIFGGINLLGNSANVSAITFNINLNPTGKSLSSNSAVISTSRGNYTLDSNKHIRISTTGLYDTTNINSIKYNSSMAITAGNYYKFEIGFTSYKETGPVIWNSTSTNTNFPIVSINPISESTYFPNTTFGGDCVLWSNQNGNYRCTQYGAYSDYARFTTLYEVIIEAKNSGNLIPEIVNSDSIFRVITGTNYDMIIFVSDLYEYQVGQITQGEQQITDSVNDVNDTLKEQQQQEQQDRDDLTNTSDDSKDQADEASGEATAQATSLLQAFISFVNWVTDIKATNCNLNIGELYGFNIGNLNLCTYSPPQWVSGALGIVIGLAIAGMSYHIVKRIIKIYETIIGGDKG